MPQTKLGAAKVVAAKAGVSLAEYQRRIASGEKWCYRCREFKRASEDFSIDRARHDGRKSICLVCSKEIYNATYQPKNNPGPFGPKPKPSRDGDRKQARSRINHLVADGKLAHPSTLPCALCGHIWQERDSRHEYHHHKGYAAAHHFDVIALCNPCHRRTTWKDRKQWARKRT